MGAKAVSPRALQDKKGRALRLLFAQKRGFFDDGESSKVGRRKFTNTRLAVTRAAALEMEFTRCAGAFRQEERVAETLQTRGDAPGLVHVFSALERCTTFKCGAIRRRGHTKLHWARAASACISRIGR